MRVKYAAFVGPSNVLQSGLADSEETINLYLEGTQSEGAKTRATLYSFPGLNLFLTFVEGPLRALFGQEGQAFAVAGFKAYEFFSDGSFTELGEVALDANPATISANFQVGQVFFTSGTIGYIYDIDTTAFTQVVTAVTAGGFVDGYFVAFDAVLSVFKISDLEDGTTWDPAQAVQRNTAGDKWVGMLVKNREVWLFGSQTSDVYVNTGAFPFPFEPIPQVLIQKGSGAGFSAAVLEEIAFWVGANDQGQGIVCRSNGYGADKISTHAVDTAIQSYGTISDAVGYAFQDQGHTFYMLNFITAGVTWVYDMSTGAWTKRLFWNSTNNVWEAHRGICHCFAFDQHFIGDRSTGVIYTQAVDIYTDADEAPLRRLRRAPHISDTNEMLFCGRFQIDMQVGVGNANAPGDNPQAMLRVSRDGGETWGNSRWKPIGRIGKSLTRVLWRRLGRARDWVFEVTFSAAVPIRINQAWLNLTKGEDEDE